MIRASSWFIGLAAVLVVAGCQQSPDASGFLRAMPRAQDVEIKVPTSDTARHVSSSGTSALVGQVADFYTLTRSVTLSLNGGTAWTLVLVHTIAGFPVTSVDGDTLVWGPWDGDALAPSQYRLTAVQVDGDDGDDWAWSLEGRRKADGAGAPFQSVVSGVAQGGHGTMSLDFDVAEALDPLANDGQGQLEVQYDLAAASVAMDYAHADDEPGQPEQITTFHYEYDAAADGSGVFLFDLHDDLDHDGSAWEHASVTSAWLGTGAGRSDFTITDGDAGPVGVSGAECWDASFLRVYFTATADWAPTEGDPAACAL
jgi:hypothetical protein